MTLRRAMALATLGVAALAATAVLGSGDGTSRLRFPQKTETWATDKLELELDLDLDAPMQHVALALEHGPVAATVLMGRKSGGNYAVVVNLPQDVPNFVPGKYSLTVYASDPDAEPFKYSLGSAMLNTSKPVPSPQNDMYVDTMSIPEYTPPVKQEQKRPPAVLSYFFAVLVTIPWIAMVYAWTRLGINISTLCMPPTSSISSAAFYLSICCMFAFLFVHWISGDIFQLLKVGGSIALVTVILGRFALVDRAGKRLKSEATAATVSASK